MFFLPSLVYAMAIILLPLIFLREFVFHELSLFVLFVVVIVLLFFVLILGPAIVLTRLGAKECKSGEEKEIVDGLTSLIGMEKVKVMRVASNEGRFFYLQGFFYPAVIVIDEYFEKNLNRDEKKALLLNSILRFKSMSARSRTLCSFVLIIISTPFLLFEKWQGKKKILNVLVHFLAYFYFPIFYLHRVVSRFFINMSTYDKKVSYYQAGPHSLISGLSKMSDTQMPKSFLERCLVISSSVVYYKETTSFLNIINSQDLKKRVGQIEKEGHYGR